MGVKNNKNRVKILRGKHKPRETTKYLECTHRLRRREGDQKHSNARTAADAGSANTEQRTREKQPKKTKVLYDATKTVNNVDFDQN